MVRGLVLPFTPGCSSLPVRWMGRPSRVLTNTGYTRRPSWWALAQDERRNIMTAGGHITPIGTAALPAVARRLHHCRELGTLEEQPFDFLTWFEYAAADEPVFDELLASLRATPEWNYVDREVEIRLRRL